MSESTPVTPATADLAWQDRILQGVSRTFALTIPQLPAPLSTTVGNAYLLCRIADTIEDDKHLPLAVKRAFADRFIGVVAGAEPAASFAAELHVLLSPTATDDERELIANTPAAIRITHSFALRQRAALERCIRIMADGMARYQEADVHCGLKDLPDMNDYCYYVAGVVGEMLTELFCAHSPQIDAKRAELAALAVSFGQGLQMTNILKDIWDDRQRGMCWLPRAVFARHGADLADAEHGLRGPGFESALGELIGVARSHLANALRYTLLIPAHETGIRRFCLWALGMAVLTLRRINAQRAFTSGQDVKISRRSVRATILVSNLLTRHDALLRLTFRLAAAGLPPEPPATGLASLAGTA
jgi:farnesyl-diphosphate farnesyltransferase